MSSEISPQNEQFIRESVADGRYESWQDALNRAVQLLREEAETIDAINQGLESIERGEGTPLAEADAKFREEHDIH